MIACVYVRVCVCVCYPVISVCAGMHACAQWTLKVLRRVLQRLELEASLNGAYAVITLNGEHNRVLPSIDHTILRFLNEILMCRSVGIHCIVINVT